MKEKTKTTIKVPKKFKKTGKSFLPKLLDGNTISFTSFPTNIVFSGKEEEEDVVLKIRSHWVFLIPKILLAFCIPLMVIFAYAFIDQIFGSFLMFLGIFTASLLISLSMVVMALMKWYYNINIITDQRVIDLDFHNVLSHTLAEAQLEKIEDISYTVYGLVGSAFDIGTVYIQTASATAEIEFQNIPRPSDVQDILSDLLELKQKGKI